MNYPDYIIHCSDCPLSGVGGSVDLYPHNYIFTPCLLAPHCESYKTIYDRFNLLSREKRSLFLTLNFGTFDPAIIQQVLAYNFPFSCIYTFEFYNSVGNPHMHVHILFDLGDMRVRKERIISKFAKDFNLKKNFIDYRFQNSVSRYCTLFNYIKGEKTEKKMESCLKDDEKRKELNLLKYYTYI